MLLSELEELVLLAAGQSGADAYGLVVANVIRRATGRSLSLATVHAALYRLEEKGYLKSKLGGATNERGGRRKRIFMLTNSGFAALRERSAVRVSMWDAVRRLNPSGGAA